MEITIIREGGLAGIREKLGPVDTTTLGAVGAEVEARVEAAGFFAMPKRLPGGGGPDRFWNKFTIVDSDRSHTVGYSDGTDADQLPSLQEIEGVLVAAGVEFEPVFRSKEGMSPEDGCFDWSAWYNEMPGADDPDLHVVGTCELRSGSARADLELTNVGVALEPGLVALRLSIEYPPVGTDDIDVREITWQKDVGPDVKRVRIVGDAEAEFDVTTAT